MAPRNKLPASPIKNLAGCQFKKRNIKSPAFNVKINGDIDKYKYIYLSNIITGILIIIGG